MNVPVRRTATLVLLLLAVLPAFAGNTAGAQKPIAVQMYTLRNAGPLDQQLKIVHDAGVRAVETVGTQNASAVELKQLLDRYSIKAVSSHVQLAELRDNLMPWWPSTARLATARWWCPTWTRRTARTMPPAGPHWDGSWAGLPGRCAARGCSWPTTTTTSSWSTSMAEPDWSCCSTPPAPSCRPNWTWPGSRAGLDPVVMLGKFRGHVFAVHAKDNAPKGQAEDEGGFAAVGQGVLDWNAILPAAANAGVQWYIVEHDQPRDPAKVIQAGADYLREHLTTNPPTRAHR